MFWMFCLCDFRGFCAHPVCSKTYIFVVRFVYFQGPNIIGNRPRNAEERPRNGQGTARGGIAGRLGPQAAAIVKDNY